MRYNLYMDILIATGKALLFVSPLAIFAGVMWYKFAKYMSKPRAHQYPQWQYQKDKEDV